MDLSAVHVDFWWAVALGAALMGAELLAPATVFLWAGISCLAVALVIALDPALSLMGALELWIALSFITVIAVRRYHRNHPLSGERLAPGLEPNRYGGEFVGMTAVLKHDSEGGQARVTLKGGNWGIKLPGGDLKAGARIRITAVDGIFLVAEPEGPAAPAA